MRNNDDVQFDSEVLSGRISSFSLLLQVIMGIAFTSGTLVFLAGEKTNTLRSWSSYTTFDIIKYCIFAINAIMMVYGASVSLPVLFKFIKTLRLKRVRLVSDYFFNVVEALLFVVLSLTLGQNANIWDFFYVIAAFLFIDLLYSLTILMIGTTIPRTVMFVIFRNMAALGAAFYITRNISINQTEALLGIFGLWTIVNMIDTIRSN